MGIMEFFRSKNKNVEVVEKQNMAEEVVEQPFVADISMYELDNIDYTNFGRTLKQKRLLPNSYIKTPSRVDVSLDKNKRPMVTLEFKSATSNSIREFVLGQDGVRQYVNGNINDLYDEEILKVWNNFQNEIRYINKIKTNRNGYMHRQRGQRLMRQATKMMDMYDIYDREQAFLKLHKDVIFDGFDYNSHVFYNDGTFEEIPQFIPLIETKDGKIIESEPALPFTPKTLEFCILHMTDGQKIEDGEYPKEFEEKCRKIQEVSCYESADWDKVINFGKEIVKKQYQANCINEM